MKLKWTKLDKLVKNGQNGQNWKYGQSSTGLKKDVCNWKYGKKWTQKWTGLKVWTKLDEMDKIGRKKGQNWTNFSNPVAGGQNDMIYRLPTFNTNWTFNQPSITHLSPLSLNSRTRDARVHSVVKTEVYSATPPGWRSDDHGDYLRNTRE